MVTREVELVVTVAGIAPCGTEYGLQDKSGQLLDGAPQPGGEESFRCTVTVRQAADGAGPPGGPYVHGKSGARFLYLSFRGTDGEWMRRTKIALPDRVEPAVDRLETRVRDVGTPWVDVDRPWGSGPGA